VQLAGSIGAWKIRDQRMKHGPSGKNVAFVAVIYTQKGEIV
jgi:hypothetical protein